MSVSVNIVGVASVDKGKFKDMMDLKKLCDKQKVDYPKQVKAFFDKYGPEDWDDMDNEYIQESMGEVNIDDAITGEVEYGGAVLDLTKLPDGIKSLKIYMS